MQEGEEYVAEGPSIKKAQQAAAKKALESSKLPRPPSNRMPRKRPPLTGKDFGLQSKNPPCTKLPTVRLRTELKIFICIFTNIALLAPTVALNDLATKLNLVPEYSNLSPPAICNAPFLRPPPPPPPHQMFSFSQPR